MKTSVLVFAFSLLGALAPLQAAPSCCEAMEAGAPLPAKSVYQLPLHLTDDEGHEVELTKFVGHPVVVAMIYTQCQYACPILVQDMKNIRGALPDESAEKPRFLLVSFDNVHDTTAALHTYREQHALDQQWTIVRGSPEDVRTLAMVLGVQFKKEANGFAHSNLITILNESGEIAYQQTGLKSRATETANAILATTQKSG
jgi:protein SCO1/2